MKVGKKRVCLSKWININKKEKFYFFSFFILKDACFIFLHIGIPYLN